MVTRNVSARGSYTFALYVQRTLEKPHIIAYLYGHYSSRNTGNDFTASKNRNHVAVGWYRKYSKNWNTTTALAITYAQQTVKCCMKYSYNRYAFTAALKSNTQIYNIGQNSRVQCSAKFNTQIYNIGQNSRVQCSAKFNTQI